MMGLKVVVRYREPSVHETRVGGGVVYIRDT